MAGYLHLHLMPKEVQPQVAATLPRFGRTLMLRCSCHEYRTLAQGGMEFVLSGILNPWDHAAGVLVAQKAGGHAAMLDGREYNAGITEGYLLTASSKAAWDKVAEVYAFLVDTPKGESDG